MAGTLCRPTQVKSALRGSGSPGPGMWEPLLRDRLHAHRKGYDLGIYEGAGVVATPCNGSTCRVTKADEAPSPYTRRQQDRHRANNAVPCKQGGQKGEVWRRSPLLV